MKAAATISSQKVGTAQKADGRIVERRRVTGYRELRALTGLPEEQPQLAVAISTLVILSVDLRTVVRRRWNRRTSRGGCALRRP